MKTLKILALICFGLGFANSKADAQPLRTEFPGRVGFYLPCVDEWIVGDIIVERVEWRNVKSGTGQIVSKIQLKYDHVTLYGRTSHLEYNLNFISSSVFPGEGSQGQGADINHFVRMAMVRLDGKLIALLPILVQKVETPDGEIVVNIDDRDVRCF
jgi:hypothetical protein